MLSSSSSLFDAESDTSQSCKVGESSVLPKLVIGVEADAGPELVEEEAAAAAAVVEANEEPALGG